MFKLVTQVKTKDLVRALQTLGFAASSTKGVHTIFKHADGAIVTIPTGRNEIPDVFVKAVIGQTTARNLASGDEIRRLLNAKPAARKAVSRKAVMSA